MSSRFLRYVCLGVFILGSAVSLTGCFLPATGNMQSARTADKGQFRVSPYVSSVETTDPDGERIANQFGGIVGAGVGNRVELQVRYDRISFVDGGDGYNFTSFGPKIGAVEDVLAFNLPIGMYWGGGINAGETMQIHPSMIVTAPLHRYFEVTGAGRFMIPFNPDLSKWFNANLGVGLGPDVTKWAIMPEIGMAWDLTLPDQDPVFTYGAAIEVYLD